MAVILDPVTYKGHWKITPNDGDLAAFKVVRKAEVYFQSTNDVSGKICFNSDSGGSNTIVATDDDTLSYDGVILDTSSKVAQYIVDNS